MGALSLVMPLPEAKRVGELIMALRGKVKKLALPPETVLPDRILSCVDRTKQPPHSKPDWEGARDNWHVPVRVRVHVMEITCVDTVKQSFHCKVWIQFKWEEALPAGTDVNKAMDAAQLHKLWSGWKPRPTFLHVLDDFDADPGPSVSAGTACMSVYTPPACTWVHVRCWRALATMHAPLVPRSAPAGPSAGAEQTLLFAATLSIHDVSAESACMRACCTHMHACRMRCNCPHVAAVRMFWGEKVADGLRMPHTWLQPVICPGRRCNFACAADRAQALPPAPLPPPPHGKHRRSGSPTPPAART